MKRAFVTLCGASLFFLVGCDNGKPGGPGATDKTKQTNSTTTTTTNSTNNTGTTGAGTDHGTTTSTTTSKSSPNGSMFGNADNTFTLDMPNLTTHLKQGEAKNVTISLKRGKNFSEDVALSFVDVPKGVTIDPASPTVKHSDTEVKLTVKAADDAAVGDFTIKVKGHPTTGADAENTMKVTVDKK